jgi:hypothetical protein
MHRIIPCCAALAGLVLSLHAADSQPRLPRDKLLLYRGSDGKPVPVKTAGDWAKRRAEVLGGMETVMGKVPGKKKRCPLDVKIESEVDGGTYVRRLITYTSEPGSRVPAYLLIPRDVLAGKKKVPAILCLHGTNNVVGHGVVVGLGSTPNRAYALELAQRGYVTLAPNYPLLAKYQPDLKKLGWESGTLKAVWDNMRGLDLLASLPFVDGTRMAAIGHSLGGHNSVYTAVFDDRLRVIVSSCGLDSYLDYYKGDEKNWHPEKGWCQTRYMRKLADYRGRLAEIPFDFHEMIGALAPRHVLIIAPKKDSNFRADSVDRIAAAARPVFKLLGHEDHLMVEHPDCGHDFPTPMREKAYRLFDEVLIGAADETKPESGFKALFNGKDLDGWKEASGKSRASLAGKTEAFKGRFKVVDGKLVLDPAVKGDLYIETTRTFGKDVHIKFDFKPGAKCNNDLFLRGTKFDIVPGNKENKDVEQGKWSTFEIVIRGDRIEHRINGTTRRTSKAGATATPFKLRAEFGAIEYRNIRVKE